jgi:hypothetical protein
MAEFVRKPPKNQNYASDMAKDASAKGQSIEEEQGNNAGPGTTEEVGAGKIDIKGTSDYMGGTPDAAGK